ncbi:polyamine aminopropyltransferase [Mesotoga sp.]|jgi:spermidine synthase|uniref:Polyamine aminopropyltransferase n=1 Tax=Mesotoga infera TaxID=1236046 RepID=A0A101H199_9BACT|nr:MAG: Spermidine synthase [Mesotoga infera]KUK88402.1 MAG: Spermidine synthase [Mesotoga infera]
MEDRELRTLNHLMYMEYYTGGNAGLFMKMKRLVYSFQSPFQRIDIFEHPEFGMVLVLDGITMFTEADEFMYHEMLVHVPLFSHPDPKRVLIIGGGDGGSLREVLKHSSVEEAILCEVDPYVIDAAKLHLKEMSVELDNPKASIINENGADFVRKNMDYFDVIIVDSTDPTAGEGGHLFTKEFYSNCYKALRKDGIFCAETEDPFYDKGWVAIAYNRISSVFPVSKMYTSFMTTYPSGMWTYTIGSKEVDPLEDYDEDRVLDFEAPLRYYNTEIHRASFALPTFLKELTGQF